MAFSKSNHKLFQTTYFRHRHARKGFIRSKTIETLVRDCSVILENCIITSTSYTLCSIRLNYIITTE